MANADDIMDFILGLTKTANSVANAQLHFAEAESARLHKEKILADKAIEDEKQNTLTLNIGAVEARNKQQIEDIGKLLKSGLDYGVTLNEHVRLSDKFKIGSEMTELMDNYGLIINKDLKISQDIYGSQIDFIEAGRARNAVSQAIIDDLTSKANDLQELEDTRIHLGTEEGKKGVVDIADVMLLSENIRKGEYDYPEEVYGRGEFPVSMSPEQLEEQKRLYEEQHPEKDVIEKTFFQDKPWLMEAMKDPRFLTEQAARGPMDIEAKEVAAENAWLALQLTKGKKFDAAGNVIIGETGDDSGESFVNMTNIINDNLKSIGNLSASDESVAYIVNAMGGKAEVLTPAEANNMLLDTAAADAYLDGMETRILRAMKRGKEREKELFGTSSNEVRTIIEEGFKHIKGTGNNRLRKRAAVAKLHALIMPTEGEEGDAAGFRANERKGKTAYVSDKITGKPIKESLVEDSPSWYDMQIDVANERIFDMDNKSINAHRYLNAMFESWFNIYNNHMEFKPVIDDWLLKEFDVGIIPESTEEDKGLLLPDPFKSNQPWLGSLDEDDANIFNLLQLSEKIRRT